jgi:type IX secretion system PorP/SprF family membrane protein
MKNQINIFLFFLFAVLNGQAQDLHFSNIHSMNQQVFPEFAGLNNDLEATVYYRNQWKTLGAKFGAIGASFATTLEPKHKISGSHLSFGLNFYREQMNKDASASSGRMTIVRHQSISKLSKISFGINVGLQTLAFDPASGSWGSQHNGWNYDPTIESGESFTDIRKTKLDVGSGIIYALKYKKSSIHLLQLGFSAQHLNRPNMSFYEDRNGFLPVKKVGFASLNLKLGNRGSQFQTILLLENQGKFSSTMFGSFLKLKLHEKAKTTSSFGTINEVFLGFGAYYRSSDAFVACLMLQKSSWNISLAYDFTTSSLKNYNYSRGGVEIQMQYTINKFQAYSRY